MTQPHTRTSSRPRSYLPDGVADDEFGRSTGPGSRLSRSHRIYLGFGLVALLLIIVAAFLGGEEPLPERQIIWIAEKTTAAPGIMPTELRQHVLTLGRDHDLLLTAYVVGSQAHRVGSIDLSVNREGQREHRADRREAEIDRGLNTLVEAVAAAPVNASDEGFSLPAALQVATDAGAEAQQRGDRAEVWLSSTVLAGSVDPLVMSSLTAADPSAVVAELRDRPLGKLDLSQVDLRVVLLTPVGEGQQPLSLTSEDWRTSFMMALAAELDTQVEPWPDRSVAEPWPQSSPTPPIIPLPDPTPDLVEPPAAPDEPVVIDNVAFRPDSAELANPEATRGTINGIVDRLTPMPDTTIVEITGYCAAFGPPDGAERLSRQRANTIRELLLAAGIPDGRMRADGMGFIIRADPDKGPRDPAQRVVVVRFVPHD